jgi:GGDEF domain-containing protein
MFLLASSQSGRFTPRSVDQASIVIDQGMIVHDNARLQAKTRTLLSQDHLTGLPNRRRILALADQLVVTAQETGERLVLLRIGSTRSRRSTEAYGQRVGDQVIRSWRCGCNGICGDDDLLGRYTGTGFLLVSCNRVRGGRGRRAAPAFRWPMPRWPPVPDRWG